MPALLESWLHRLTMEKGCACVCVIYVRGEQGAYARTQFRSGLYKALSTICTSMNQAIQEGDTHEVSPSCRAKVALRFQLQDSVM